MGSEHLIQIALLAAFKSRLVDWQLQEHFQLC